jgi:hypothetical protein
MLKKVKTQDESQCTLSYTADRRPLNQIGSTNHTFDINDYGELKLPAISEIYYHSEKTFLHELGHHLINISFFTTALPFYTKMLLNRPFELESKLRNGLIDHSLTAAQMTAGLHRRNFMRAVELMAWLVGHSLSTPGTLPVEYMYDTNMVWLGFKLETLEELSKEGFPVTKIGIVGRTLAIYRWLIQKEAEQLGISKAIDQLYFETFSKEPVALRRKLLNLF